MQTSSIIVMVGVLTFFWGGFAYFMYKLVSISKNQETN